MAERAPDLLPPEQSSKVALVFPLVQSSKEHPPVYQHGMKCTQLALVHKAVTPTLWRWMSILFSFSISRDTRHCKRSGANSGNGCSYTHSSACEHRQQMQQEHMQAGMQQ